MSSPDQPPAQFPYTLQPFPSNDASGYWAQNQMAFEQSDSQSQVEQLPPFKRPRNYDFSTPNSAPLPSPMNAMNVHPNQPMNRGSSNIFFKTRMCLKFMDGNCRNGENCSFAHGSSDLREPPPNWQDMIREKDMGNWTGRKICRKYANGEECPYGERCNFLHERQSAFRDNGSMQLPRETLPREHSAISIGTTGPVMEYRSVTDLPEVNKHVNANFDAFQVNIRPTYWKTKMCSKWEITGQCPYGERCHYAHGQSELQVSRGYNIETEEMINIGPTKVPLLPENDVAPTIMEAPVPANECKENEDKTLLSSKWKLNRKITSIYGDWPEDLIPPENLPSAW